MVRVDGSARWAGVRLSGMADAAGSAVAGVYEAVEGYYYGRVICGLIT